MRTTIDLDDNLYRRIKILAAIRGQSLKDFLKSILEREISGNQNISLDTMRVEFPLVPSKKPLSKNVSAQSIAKVMEEEDIDVFS